MDINNGRVVANTYSQKTSPCFVTRFPMLGSCYKIIIFNILWNRSISGDTFSLATLIRHQPYGILVKYFFRMTTHSLSLSLSLSMAGSQKPVSDKKSVCHQNASCKTILNDDVVFWEKCVHQCRCALDEDRVRYVYNLSINEKTALIVLFVVEEI